MRIKIESVYDTAYKYREVLKKYGYEHIKIVEREDDISDLSQYHFKDYITINSVEDILELSKEINIEIIICNTRIDLKNANEPFLLIYDDYIE